MDFDLLWDLGGWFLGLDCMAASTAIDGSSSKSQAFLLFVSLLFMLLLLARPADQLRMSMASSFPSKKLLSESSTTTQSTMKLHPQQTKTPHHTSSSSTSTSTRQFEASAHEVPSGPNPISNR
uniref:CLAVATA3/ESR (CLE)-related protein 44 n=1 Tax=Nelumbo nucifera TaxID=4432 RepID=A0A822XXR3_NELNU|nr:TPA_asm: hypothetical protein HUJ06_025362 [Nelumbo nucifera]